MELKNKNLKKDIFVCLCLVIAFFGLLYIMVPEGTVYGSNTDWMSQHVSLAETLRDEILRQKTILPDFLWIGGGNNVYNFSYYGYLRPDVLIGCLMPSVPMEKVIIITMISSFLLTVLLCYYWLRKCMLSPGPAFLGSFFCMSANCFFHFHRQIMFINYMPFLFLALIFTERTLRTRHILLYCLFLAGICFQSYYYSICCFIVIAIYWWQNTKEWKDWLLLVKIMALSVGLSLVLLWPTFLALLENRRASGKTSLLSLLLPKLQLKGLLYDPYGIGFSMIILYLLLLGLFHKKYRVGSIGCLCLFCFPVIPYLLNGTLYTRAKILMPFLPLILLHCMRILSEVWNGKMKPSSRLASLILILVCVGMLWTGNGEIPAAATLVLADIALILLFSWIWKWKNKAVVYILLLVVPMMGTFFLSKEEDFVPETSGEEIFTKQELEDTITDEWVRTDYLTNPLINANQLHFANQKTTGMYSSVSNKRYAAFYYDILKTPIRINNRVALLPEVNPFLQYIMGVKYVVTNTDKVPGGYRSVYEKGDYTIAKNDNVLPIAYLNNRVISRENFETLTEPYSLEALTRYTVVEDEVLAEKFGEQAEVLSVTDELAILSGSKMRQMDFEFQVAGSSSGLSWEKMGNGIEVKAEKNGECTLRLKNKLKGKIGILSFDVVNGTKWPVEITINGMRNKLAGKGAPYPNQNERFTFFLNERIANSLELHCNKGKFQIQNLTYHVLTKYSFNKDNVKTVEFLKGKGGEVLHCRTDEKEQSLFVTSIPYQDGLALYVDGKKADIQLVNTAFAGALLEPGRHDVKLLFTPPGKRLGLFGTVAACILLLLNELLVKINLRNRVRRTDFIAGD